MFANLNKFPYPIILLIIVLLFHLFNNAVVIRLNNAPFVYDEYAYYNNSLSLFYSAKINNYRPPLFSLLSQPVFTIFGTAQKTSALFLGGFSLLVLMLATYLLGKSLFSKGVGLLSAFILSCFPVIFGHSRSFMPDLLLCTCVVTTILLMVQPNAFLSKRSIVTVGVVIGLGMLAGLSYLLYIIAPFVYILKKKTDFNKKILCNLILVFLISVSVCGFWCLPNFYNVVRENIKAGQFRFFWSDGFIGFSWLFEYVFEIFENGMSLISLPLLAVIFMEKKKSHSLWIFLLFIWMAVPYFIFSLLAMKNIRFVMPIFPAIAIIFSFWVLNIENYLKKVMVVSVIILIGLAQVVFISYSPVAKRVYNPAEVYNEFNQQRFGLVRPWKKVWPLGRIFKAINSVNPKRVIFIKTRNVIIDGIQNITRQQEGSFQILLSNQELCCDYQKRQELIKEGVLFPKLLQADVVALQKNTLVWACENENTLEQEFMNSINRFTAIGTLFLPDNSQLDIYKRNE